VRLGARAERQDEGLNPNASLSAPYGAYPWQDSAAGLAHMLYGVVTDALERSAKKSPERVALMTEALEGGPTEPQTGGCIILLSISMPIDVY